MTVDMEKKTVITEIENLVKLGNKEKVLPFLELTEYLDIKIPTCPMADILQRVISL